MEQAFNIGINNHNMMNDSKMPGIQKIIVSKPDNEICRPINRISIFKMKINTMINNLCAIAPWKRVLLLVPVLFLNIFSLHAQDQKAQDSILVKGVIVSGTNTPLSNITISIEGSSQQPVVSNDEGRFSIKSSSGENWLIVSPVSDFKTKRVFLNNRNELKIYLTTNDLPAGDDPLAILSQKRTNKDIVSSFFSMKAEDNYKTSAFSIDEAMQGRIPGMNVIRREGAPGTGAISFIRGINSIMTNNQPLYIVDGIPVENPGMFGSNLDGYAYDPLIGVNMLDISNVTIVKDPTITSAYGSKASNGLILIKTLDPSAIQTSIDVDFRTGYSLAPSNLIPQLNANQHKTLANEVLFSSGLSGEIIREKYPNLFLTKNDARFIDYQHNTNWQKKIFDDAMFTNLNIKVKGGDAIARYGLSFGYTSSNGIIKTSGYDSYNLRFVSLLNIFTWLKMNAGVSFIYTKSNMKESARSKETSPVLAALNKSPMLNPYQYDLNGNMLTTLSEVDELGVSNPVSIVEKFKGTNTNYHCISSLGFETTLKRNLTLNTNFGLTYDDFKEGIFSPNHGMSHYYNNEAINVSKASNTYLLSFYNNTYLSYQKIINKVHSISSSTGLNMMTNKYQFDWGISMNSHENDQYQKLQDGTPNLRRKGGKNKNWNWVSIYENVNYTFKDKYLVTASVSLDGSSRVGEDAIHTIKIANSPFGLFYAGGIGWRISNESFLNKVSWLDELKLRMSYGKSGNDDIGESSASDYYESGNFRETVGLSPAVVPNKSLSYETVSQINAGADFSLSGSRIRASIDVFRSTINDMLILTPLKSYYGYSYRPENGGDMQNTGFEMNASFRIVDGRSFKWDIQANLSKVKNEVLALHGGNLISHVEGAEIANQVGHAANSFYGYIFKGVFSSAEEAQAANLRNEKFVKYSAGDAIYVDLSGPAGTPDGIINQYDKTCIGSSMPEIYGGMQNTFTYKRWTLNTLINFVSGNEIFNYVRSKNESMTGLENQSATVLNRWQYDRQVTDVPRTIWNDPIGNSSFSTRWIEDGSFLRIQNISLSYRIPNGFLQFRSAEFYVSANNILTLSKYLGYDPEFSYSYSHAEQGIDYGQTPQPRQFVIGIKLGL